MAAEPTRPVPGPENGAGEAAWLAELARSILRAGDIAGLPGNRNLAAIETRSARAVQGLALQRAFSQLACPVARVRIVRLVEIAVAAERELPP